MTRLLQSVYGTARRVGLLDTAPGRALFRWAYFRYKRYVEDACHHMVARFGDRIRAGHVLDVGANIGYSSRLFARALGPGFKVYAFEPEAWNFGMLVEVATREARIVAVPKAVGAAPGHARLTLNPRHHGDHRIAVASELEGGGPLSPDVEVVSLDAFARAACLSPVALIKIDVQGFEAAVCRGMERVLDANPAALVMLELSPASLARFGSDRAEILDFFDRRGLRAGVLTHARGFEERPYDRLPVAAGPDEYVDLVFSAVF